jgi:hypothetical protein
MMIVKEAVGNILKPKSREELDNSGALFINDIFFKKLTKDKFFHDLGRISYDNETGEAGIYILDEYINNQIGVVIRATGSYNRLRIDFGYYLWPGNKVTSDIWGKENITKDDLKNNFYEKDLDKILNDTNRMIFLNPPSYDEIKKLIDSADQTDKLRFTEKIKKIKNKIITGYYFELHHGKAISFGPFNNREDAEFIFNYAKNNKLLGADYTDRIKDEPAGIVVSGDELKQALDGLLNNKTLYSTWHKSQYN